MSQPRGTATANHRLVAGTSRLVRAWRVLPHERRLAAYAALGLFLVMFLPWYQRQFFAVVGGKLQPASDSQTAWGAFSFVEAAVLLVSAGVLTLLFQRAEGRAFHIPGGDGWAITAAGFWTGVLIVWRIFDKQGGTAHGQDATTYGIEWGIFIALGVAASLVYAGNRIRAAHRPEPPLPGEKDLAAPPRPATPPDRPARPATPADRPTRPPRPVRADDQRRVRVEDQRPGRVEDQRPGRVEGPPPGRVEDQRPGRVEDPPTRRMGSPSTQAAKTRSAQADKPRSAQSDKPRSAQSDKPRSAQSDRARSDEQLTIPLDEV